MRSERHRYESAHHSNDNEDGADSKCREGVTIHCQIALPAWLPAPTVIEIIVAPLRINEALNPKSRHRNMKQPVLQEVASTRPVVLINKRLRWECSPAPVLED